MDTRWYLDDYVDISSDGRSEASSDSISFNGQIFIAGGSTSYSGERGIVYVDDDIESDEEEKCAYTLDDICKGQSISVCTDPQKIRFEILSTRIDEQSKRVFYSVMVLRIDDGIDKDKGSVERSYSDFTVLNKALRKEFPSFLKDVNFPGKVLGQSSNLNSKVIESRRVAFQAFLQTVYPHPEVRKHPAFKEFFYLPDLRKATDHLIGCELDAALALFLNSFHLQVKLSDEVREVIATLAAIVIIFETQGKLEDAARYSITALNLVQEDYLCPYVIPILDTLVRLMDKLQMDKNPVVRRLNHVQRMAGVDVEQSPTLQALVSERFD
ncbi:Sorting nexin-21 [Acropora cervicornis]|uniref:Sorting nexin-21 n=1 Tax=Acropora cervicornis TaxID=6130 RepID=A0AAD9UUD4_ACRCE|nr:Sorting nexin-21 [Acropora cervicornis]